jgi:hypothetical protein
MKKIAGSLITLVLLLAVLSTPLFADDEPLLPSCSATTTTLVAGQHLDAGVVSVSNDEGNLKVEFVALNGWSLGETHLYVGSEPPTKTAPGRFPYKGETVYTFPLSDLEAWPGDVLYIAAHAVVQKGTQQETAWGEGSEFGKNWAKYFACTVDDAPSVSEE